jgi:hypothetical protein
MANPTFITIGVSTDVLALLEVAKQGNLNHTTHIIGDGMLLGIFQPHTHPYYYHHAPRRQIHQVHPYFIVGGHGIEAEPKLL